MKGQRRLLGSRSGGEWSKVTAAIVGIEPKVAKDGDGYHVHGHGFLVCSEPLDYRLHHNDPDYVANDGTILSKLTREWYEATENESYNVNVRWIPSRDSPEWHKAIMEVVNYTVWGAAAEINDEKTADARALDILIGTKNRRFFEAYGAFRAIDAEKQDPHAGPYVFYSYRPGSRGYVPVMATDIFPLEVERRGLQAQIGRAVGGYRGARRDLLASGLATAAGMDKIKASFRATCSDLSGRYSRRTEAMRAFIGAIVPALHGLPNAAKTIINAETWRAFYADIDPCPI
jgi:hypothetical protein